MIRTIPELVRVARSGREPPYRVLMGYVGEDWRDLLVTHRLLYATRERRIPLLRSRVGRIELVELPYGAEQRVDGETRCLSGLIRLPSGLIGPENFSVRASGILRSLSHPSVSLLFSN